MAAEHRGLRYLRSTLEVMVWLAAVVLVVVFARGAGMNPPPYVEVTGRGGFVTTYGIRMTLMALFLIACALLGALFLFARFPRLYRYPVEITAKNVELQYMLAKIMMSGMQMICAAYFIIVMVNVYNMAITLRSPGFKALTAVCVAMAAAVYLWYTWMSRKYR